MSWMYGGGILITLSLATMTALLTEACMLKLRARPIKPFLSDYSAVITAWLLALAIPPLTPLVAHCRGYGLCYCYRQTIVWWVGLQPF